jgi:hydrogenase-4 component F
MLAMVVVPLVVALAAMALPGRRLRPWLVVLGAAVHLALTVKITVSAAEPAYGGWLRLDGLDRLVLAFTSVLFFLSAVYAVGYLSARSDRDNRVFCACLLAFLAMSTLVIEAHHLGLMWVAVEASTLAAAPLIYFHRTPRSLEAVWKYLMVGSVGVALALFGSFFLAYAALRGGTTVSLLFEDLVRTAPHLARSWLHPAFILLFIGYGTKMGLAPMHAWKPDAYGEAPGVVGALLSSGLTSCAFLAILRFYRIVTAAHEGAFAREMMVTAGLLSLAVAAIFVTRQRDYKRLLAYSSVEHMGILVLGVGIGGAAVFGAVYHMLTNGFTKGVLFLTAGNLQRAYGSKRTEHVAGALRRLPLSGALFLAGFFAITGSPPFGPFQSELLIVRAAFDRGSFAIGGSFLALLGIIFVGMAGTVLAVTQGRAAPPAEALPGQSLGESSAPPDGSDRPADELRDTFLTVAPAVAFLGLSLLLGVYLPDFLASQIHQAAASLEAE